MCGIVGQIRREAAPDKLRAMLAAVAHRGPDGEGVWTATGDWCVELGHRRLSIIDIETGAQPMSSADVHIVYNGEVYNFVALRMALQTAGGVFRTRSDTEVVLEHVRRHDVGGLAELNGMFAFAVWDAPRRRLLLARDRAGVKPLYYATLPDGGIAFGSELSAVLIATGPQPLCGDAIASYFFLDYVQQPLAMTEGVHKLAPGHSIAWHDGALGEPQPFWSMPARQSTAPRDDLWQQLGDAVESHLVADVPVGVFLSGGVDSSVVAALAAARTGRRLKAFTIGFSDPTFDETAEAEIAARAIGVEHIVERLDERNLLDIVDAALDGLDEPLADPSLLPTHLLSRLAARHVKVVLSGDGGDELFGGYATYRAHVYARYFAWAPSLLRRGLMQAVNRLPIDDRYQSFEWKARRFTQRWDDRAARRHLRWLSGLDLDELSAAVPRSRAEMLIEQISPPSSRDTLADIMSLDFATYLPGSVLTKVDRASMAHGLEARPPLLDNRVVQAALSMPSRLSFRGAEGKISLKQAASGHLPKAIVWRKKKGFGIPLSRWLRGALRDKLRVAVASSPLWETGWVDPRAFQRYEKEHVDGKADWSKPLWALLVLDRWMRRHQPYLLLGGSQ